MLLMLLSLAAGASYVLAFAPINQSWLALIAPALLLYCWKNATTKQAFLYGFLFGIGQFGVGTSWVYVSIHHFGNANIALAALITALFTTVLAMYPALQGLCFRKFFQQQSPFIQYLLAFPISWVFFEWLRAWLFSGFPWLLLGYSQTNTLLNSYAPLIGVYGISLLLAVLNGIMVLIFSPAKKNHKIMAAIILFVIPLAALLFYNHHWSKKNGKPVSVALIQGNTPQSMKWDPQQLQHIIKRYVQTTVNYLGTQLIVWPEAAIPVTAQQAPHLISDLDRIAKNRNSSVIIGIPDSDTDNNNYYNAMRIIGNGSGVYRKRHLVPFGEYTPLGFIVDPVMRYFDIPMSDLSAGNTLQTPLTAQHITIAPFICYEIAYPCEALKIAKDKQLIVVINDDSWFGNSLASGQQVEMAQMRALETGRYVLYASNTGVTTIISPSGKQLVSAPENVFAVLNGEIYAMQGNTPLTHYGYYPLLAIMIILLIIAIASPKKRSATLAASHQAQTKKVT